MNPYPNYYQQMNNYGQQYNPQQPYRDRIAGLQQYHQGLQMQQPQMAVQNQQMQIGINGRVVPNVENITANDVPMDGSVAFFPMQDMSQILAKSWNADGTIKTVIYKPFLNETDQLTQTDEKLKLGLSDDVTEAFMDKFNELSEKIDRIEQSMTKSINKSTASRAKKEGDTE